MFLFKNSNKKKKKNENILCRRKPESGLKFFFCSSGHKHTSIMSSVMNSFKKLTIEERAEIKEKFADVSSFFCVNLTSDLGQGIAR